MSIPNMITLVRIVLTPVFVCFYLEGEKNAALTILAAAAFSDMLDGFIARRFKMITPLGKVLDPVADKLLQLAMLLCLVSFRPELWLLLMLHVLREGLLGAMGYVVYRRCGSLIGSRWYGKLCTALLYVFLGSALIWPQMPQNIMDTGIFSCSLLIIYCLCRYAAEYVRLLHEGRESIKNHLESQ